MTQPINRDALLRVVVGVDPAASANEQSDETGIIVAGRDRKGHGYILADYSGRYTPNEWAKRVVGAFNEYHADRVIAEANNGGLMVEETLRSVAPSLPIKLVHASHGKAARAEPIAALYEQGKVHHAGQFPLLEEQLCTWEPLSGHRSPDRLDALVWALTELLVGNVPTIVRGATKDSRWRDR